MPIYQAPTPTPTAAVAQPAVPRPGAAAVYEALSNQKTVLRDQLEELTDQRSSLVGQLNSGESGISGPVRSGLEQRVASLDKSIAGVDQQIALVDGQIANAAAVPGAVVPKPEPIHRGPPDEVYVLIGMFMFVFLLPLSIAFARRIWKRSSVVVQNIPADLMARIQRIEHAVESSSLELERIGEGQRFITKLFSEKSPVMQLPAKSSESGEKGA
jgi:hypothetical protein